MTLRFPEKQNCMADLDILFEQDLQLLQRVGAAPVQPVRWEFGIPFYTSQQVDLFGLPEHWGVDQYQIIELREDATPFVTDYDMEMDRRGSLRPIHHYNRVERFESILLQLLGCRGKVPRTVIDHIKERGYDHNPVRIWDSIRTILKEKKWRQYYNRIPIILNQLGYQEKIEYGDQNAFVLELINEFKKISHRFEEIKETLKRKYFPNLRYVAFKLLQEYGATFQYQIPFLRTPRKEKHLDELWLMLRNKVSQK